MPEPERRSRVRINLNESSALPRLENNVQPTIDVARSVGALPLRETRVWPELNPDEHWEQIESNVAYLNTFHDGVATYADLLGGLTVLSAKPEGQMEINDRKVLKDKGLLDTKTMSFSPGLKLEGVNYPELKRHHAMEQYKFYSSFDLTTHKQAHLGDQWFSEVVDRAHTARIPLMTKEFDHSYDSLNLYTWKPQELAVILQDLYPRYLEAGLYNATEHFLQGALEGVNPKHIGYVQEPALGWPVKGKSFTTRMNWLGRVLDRHRDELITPERFIEAAAAAGVNPARPYLIDPHANTKTTVL